MTRRAEPDLAGQVARLKLTLAKLAQQLADTEAEFTHTPYEGLCAALISLIDEAVYDVDHHY